MADPPRTTPAEPDPGTAWMLAYQAGDEAAFDALVEHYAEQVYALLTRFLGNAPNREDLVQEVFLRVLRARDRYRPTARFSTFLYRIAFNLSANERERASHRRHAALGSETEGEHDEPEPADDAAAGPGHELERADLVRQVRAAIAELPEKQRMALILAKYEELPYTQIASVLETTEQAVKSLVHRAREALRARLSPSLLEEIA